MQGGKKAIYLQSGIEIWCNGSTSDFGSLSRSSNLLISTDGLLRGRLFSLGQNLMTLDTDTLELLYYSYLPRLTNFAARYVTDTSEAEDIVEEVYIKFWEKYSGKESDRWHHLLYKMVRNSCLDHIRHNSVNGGQSLNSTLNNVCEERLYNWDMSNEGADSRTMLQDLRTEVDRIMSGLPERCREVFMLSRFSDMKNKEIASKLGISEKAVEKHITKALRKFSSELEDEKQSFDFHKTLILIFLLG